MIKAVIFDLDGTLLDRDASLEAFIEDQYNRLANYLQHIPKTDFTRRFIELDAKGYVWKDQVYQQLIEEFAVKGIDWPTLLEDYIANFSFHCVPFPNLKDMLDQLVTNSLRLGMITNGRGQFQMDNILALEIKNHFDEILISEWEEMAKPEPAIFRKALTGLGISPAEAVYIGDHPKNDIQAAGAVGMKTLWKKDQHWSCLGADGEIDDLSEIVGWIERFNAKTSETALK